MWMIPDLRQGQQKRRGGQPVEWGLFGNNLAHKMPHGIGGWPGKTEVRREG